jgi:hypothetical protein
VDAVLEVSPHDPLVVLRLLQKLFPVSLLQLGDELMDGLQGEEGGVLPVANLGEEVSEGCSVIWAVIKDTPFREFQQQRDKSLLRVKVLVLLGIAVGQREARYS